MVGRSRSITGPFLDRAAVPMLEGGGTEVLRGYNEIPRGAGTVVENNGCGYEGANIGLWKDLGNTCQH